MKRLQKKPIFRYFLVIALVLLPFAVSPKPADADAVEDLRDVLDDSRPTYDSAHEIYFVTPSGVAASSDFTVTFDSAGQLFNLTGLLYTDIDLAVDDDNGCDGSWSEQTLADTTPTATDWGIVINTSTDVITFYSPTSGTPVPTDRCLQIEIGDNATGGGTNNEINNPAAGHYDIDIAGSFGDSGTTIVVVIATITAQVTIDESLTVTISGQTAAQCANYDDGGSPNEEDTTATSVNFGTPAANTFIDACQEIDVDTNAAGGYTVTVQESDQLTYMATTIPDGTCDTGSCGEHSEGDWATNSNNGFGYCMEDVSGDGAATADAGWGTNGCDATDTYFKIFPEKDVDPTDIETIMSSAGPVNDTADLGYRLTIPGTQAAGVYTNNIILVATPTY